MNTTQETQTQALEFSRRRNLPGVEVRYMNGKRYNDVMLVLMGRYIGQKTEFLRRNVVTTTTYILPEM